MVSDITAHTGFLTKTNVNVNVFTVHLAENRDITDTSLNPFIVFIK